MRRIHKTKLLILAFIVLLTADTLLASTSAPDVTIVESSQGYDPRFPSIAKLPDGKLVMVYYSNTSHVNTTGGIIQVKTSTNNGNTWSNPTTIVDYRTTFPGLDARDPHINVLSNGDLILNFFTGKWNGSFIPSPYQEHVIETRVAKCTDGSGTNWSTPIIVPTNRQTNATSGAIIELPNGNLLLPTYGRVDYTQPASTNNAYAHTSTDGGVTWSTGTQITTAYYGEGYNETSLGYVGNTVYSISRPSGRIFKSADNGLSWQAHSLEPHYMHAPDFLPFNDNSLLLTYCIGSSELGYSDRTVYGKLFDPSQNWADSPEMVIYDPACTGQDMGYPSSVKTANNRILTIYYQNGCNNIIGGTFTDFSDWDSDNIITFEEDIIGSVPVGFIQVGGVGRVSSNESVSGSKSLEIIDNSSSALTNIVKQTTASSSKIVEFKIFPVSTPQSLCFGLASGGNSNDNAVFHLAFKEGGAFKWYDGVSWHEELNLAGDPIFNQWNSIKIIALSTQNADIYLNGVYAGTAHNWHSNFTTMDRIRFMSGSTVGTGLQYYIDDLKIENVVSPLPITFESDNIGSVPSGFVQVGSIGRVSNNESVSGSKSLEIIDNSSTVVSNIVKQTTASSSKYVEFKIFPVNSANSICFSLSSGGNYNSRAVFHFCFKDGEPLKWYDGSNWNPDLNLAGNVIFHQWNVVKILADDTQSAKVYLNGVYAGTAYKWNSFATLDRIRFMSGSTVGYGSQYYIDDVRISDEIGSLKSTLSNNSTDSETYIDNTNSTQITYEVFPSPAADFITLKNDNASDLHIELYNLSGVKLAEYNDNSTLVNIDISELNGGLYYLKITNNEEDSFVKIVKE